ncbi:MAG: class I SAM-dependent methyltransferase [Anaerolineae bacterium]|nr:class I SAM-dependent methyltransferase [Anaerolineae bacterium]
MDQSLENLLNELEQFGRDNDAAIADRPGRMLNITRDTGEFLSVLIQATNARRVLEIGTSNGYSTLWLAWATRVIRGYVTTIELSEFKYDLAATNIERAGMADVITQVRGDAGEFLEGAVSSSFDLIFLDSERREYEGWWKNLRRVVREGGLLVVDNAVSHRSELAGFVAMVSADAEFTTCQVPVGNGEFLAVRGA